MNKKGLTFIELILVVVVMGIAMAALIPFLQNIQWAWEYGDRRTIVLQNGRNATDRMMSTLRTAQSVTAIDTTAPFNFIAFQDSNNNPAVFFHNVAASPYYDNTLADNTIVMTSLVGGNPTNSVLAESVDSLVFTYLPPGMDYSNPATDPSGVQGVNMNMTLSDIDGEMGGHYLYPIRSSSGRLLQVVLVI